jgi:hypothetical protein
MRYIPLKETKLTDQVWLDKAKKLTDAVKAEPDPEERKKIIDANAKVWGGTERLAFVTL